jgi:uncharacterized protein HemX
VSRPEKRGSSPKLFGILLVFAIGVGVGYYLGERGKADAVTQAIRRTEAELQARARGAAERGGAALQSLEGGATAAAESAKAAARALTSDTVRN